MVAGPGVGGVLVQLGKLIDARFFCDQFQTKQMPITAVSSHNLESVKDREKDFGIVINVKATNLA